ncbi:MAG: hypothetical protein A4E42_01297 [Methanoregulaceae archaeon PtaU1.Bin222]|nr:MAG: hypothetical protein A4E42_01297 [Methanoregulaceae archaeon PtaU1.Bin222]
MNSLTEVAGIGGFITHICLDGDDSLLDIHAGFCIRPGKIEGTDVLFNPALRVDLVGCRSGAGCGLPLDSPLTVLIKADKCVVVPPTCGIIRYYAIKGLRAEATAPFDEGVIDCIGSLSVLLLARRALTPWTLVSNACLVLAAWTQPLIVTFSLEWFVLIGEGDVVLAVHDHGRLVTACAGHGIAAAPVGAGDAVLDPEYIISVGDTCDRRVELLSTDE